MDYNANELHQNILETVRSRFPKFGAWRIIIAGPSGCGKSTVGASFPVANGKIRRIMDNEDSMAFLDGGLGSADIYMPRKQRFAMDRTVFPTIGKYAELYKQIEKDDSNIGCVVIDNVALFQDLIVDTLKKGAGMTQALKNLYKDFGIMTMPYDSIIQKWANQSDPTFWSVAKNIPKALIMATMKHNMDMIVTTEEANVWENYGSSNAKVLGKKAKVWDIWFKYFDMVIMLKRDVNTTKPPIGQINPLQPKMRLQGMNPSWTMDWDGFLKELTAAMSREEPDIPEEAKVYNTETYDASDVPG